MEIRSNSNLRFRYLLTTLSPKWTINLLFKLCHHREPDLKNPKTLDEKIQWMKLYYYKDNDLVKQCADKMRVRNYVKSKGLENILTRVIAIYHDPDEINWDALPDKFVLKWNFGNGGNVVCTDKKNLDKAAAINDLKRFQKLKFHLLAAEPQYDVDEKVLLCEEFIEPEHGNSPVDYKFYCFNGEGIESLKKNAEKFRLELAQIRPIVDDLLRDLWTQVESFYAQLPLSKSIEKCTQFGLIYSLSLKEKKQIEADKLQGTLEF